jgi:hypothetical protein
MTCRCCGREVEGDYGGCLCAGLSKPELAQRDLPVTEGSAILRRLAASELALAAEYQAIGRAEAGTHRRSAEYYLRGAEELEREAVADSRCSDEGVL